MAQNIHRVIDSCRPFRITHKSIRKLSRDLDVIRMYFMLPNNPLEVRYFCFPTARLVKPSLQTLWSAHVCHVRIMNHPSTEVSS